MPKQKTRKSILKRLKISKRGKLIRRGSCGRHLMAGKSKRRARRQNSPKQIEGRMARKMRKILGVKVK